jgi:PHD/YefM family antitoxin component YafN of YafNO toxin-antitoxin module
VTKSETLDISQAREELNRIDRRLSESRIVWVTRHKRKAFALVDVEWLETVLETLEVLEDPEALKMLEASLEDVRRGRVYEHEEVAEDLRG